MSKKMAAIVGVTGLAAVVCLSTFRTSEAQVGRGGSGSLTPALEGNYRVYTDLAFMDKTSEKGQEELIKKIEFHPEYIVLIDQNGAGRVVPVHAIKNLKWEPS
jgi:hypothetical protein